MQTVKPNIITYVVKEPLCAVPPWELSSLILTSLFPCQTLPHDQKHLPNRPPPTILRTLQPSALLYQLPSVNPGVLSFSEDLFTAYPT
ncbi:hypothetical protein QQF64_026572 [Cirrhinus molitorella]|uniref:Uncharacterized protein n=1 Tax=Cirrhinus molitorella TaxID=172907 RepID=A0ABR3NAG7_9TELE